MQAALAQAAATGVPDVMQQEGIMQQAAAGQPIGRNKSKRNKFKQATHGAAQTGVAAEPSTAGAAPLAAHMPADAPAANGAKAVEEPGRRKKQQQAVHAEQANRAEGKQPKKARKQKDDEQRPAKRKAAVPSSAGAPEQATGLLARMREQLSGGRFRWLNEQLYTCPGEEAFTLMQGQPELFQQYHEVHILHLQMNISCRQRAMPTPAEAMYRGPALAQRGCGCPLACI